MRLRARIAAIVCVAMVVISTVWACSGVTPGASCAPITLAACCSRVSAATMVVCGTVLVVSTGRDDVEEVDVWLVLAVACVVLGWLVLVVGW